MIAVVCHDAGHDGLNNTFHVNSKSPLAKTYFNQSPLEHHHTSVALSCLGTHGCNVFENWSQAFVDFARNLISNSLLATDMLLHDQVLQDLLSYDPALLTSSLYNFSSSGQVELAFHAEQYELLRLSRLMLHAADISNTVRPFAISAHYTDKLASEFGMQVQREKELGLPVAPFMVIPDEQVKARGEIYFLTTIARPYFAALAKAFPVCQELISTLDGNIKEWALVAS
jgi:high affinity cGMP-specific 3',5'-cyclic phosphodiesterase 9